MSGRSEDAAALAAVPVKDQQAVLGDGLRIEFGHELTDLSRPDRPVYAVTDGSAGGEERYAAWLGHPSLPARYRQLQNLSKSKAAFLLKPVMWRLIQFPGQKPRLAIIAERPGSALPLISHERPVRYPEDFILKMLLPAAVKALRELDSLGLTHGAIRPDNIFFRDKSHAALTLGESFVTPPGTFQSRALESLERALANPTARGDGNIASDLFSLGVTIFILITGGLDFLDDANQDAFQAERMDQGSFMAFVTTYRLPQRIMELLKGLLADVPEHRWSLDEIEHWLNGVKIQPRHMQPQRRPSRGFAFQGVEYPTIPALGTAMGRQWNKVTETLVSKEFEIWMVRSHSAAELHEKIKNTMAQARRNESNLQGLALGSYGLVALSRLLPLYLKRQATTVDGLGSWLASNYSDHEVRTVAAEMLKIRLPLMWLETYEKVGGDWSRLARIYEKLAVYVRKPTPGYGIERALYEMNAALPCQSPLFEGYLVSCVDDVLPMLEVVASQGGSRKHSLIDRHLLAFLATYADEVTDEVLVGVAESTNAPGQSMIGVLRVLALIDRKRGGKALPHLCQWLNEALQPAVSLYRNTRRRDTVREDLEQAARAANLMKMLRVIDNPQERKIDHEEFLRAVSMYQSQEKMLEDCHKEYRELATGTRNLTWRLAPAVSGVLAALLCVMGIVLRR
jgi:hypothetical protein